jgi:nitrite reductase (NO-forming)
MFKHSWKLFKSALTKVAPGEEVVLRFKADRPGTYVYHCAPGGIMIPQ